MNGYMWRIQWHKERKYNPQGGSIPPTSLPRVASYRRQPRAIESTTPMGLRHHSPLLSHHNVERDHTIPMG